MSESKQVSSGGVGFLSLLTVLFIGLKLTGYIDWSWCWVLAPLWAGWFFILLVLFLVAVIAVATKK